MKELSADELRLNEQAVSVASSILHCATKKSFEAKALAWDRPAP